MNNKILDTALLSLSVGFLVIGIVEIITRGLGFGYLWIMFSVSLLLLYKIRKRKGAALPPAAKSDKSPERSLAGKPSAASKSRRKRK
jgi:hypothetical protein